MAGYICSYVEVLHHAAFVLAVCSFVSMWLDLVLHYKHAFMTTTAMLAWCTVLMLARCLKVCCSTVKDDGGWILCNQTTPLRCRVQTFCLSNLVQVHLAQILGKARSIIQVKACNQYSVEVL